MRNQAGRQSAAMAQERKFDFSFLVRQLLSLALFCVFLWQTVYSIDKYLAGGTSTTFHKDSPAEMSFPDVSLCALDTILAPLPVVGDTFAEEMEGMAVPEFLVAFAHGYDSWSVKPLDSNLTDENWSWTVTTNPFSLKLMRCYTYRAPGMISSGYDSTFTLHINTLIVPHVVVLVNAPGQSLLLPTSLNGRDFFKVPSMMPGMVSGYIQYQIVTRDHDVLQKEDLPCHAGGEDGSVLYDCVESFVESNASCTLPWRKEKSVYERECSDGADLAALQKVHAFIMQASEQDVYELTGCYDTCKFKEYDTRVIVEEQQPYPIAADHNFLVNLFLAPGGVVRETEILVYDFYDLVGNVGGFLGLFLGVSVLSLYDDIRGRAAKLKYLVK